MGFELWRMKDQSFTEKDKQIIIRRFKRSGVSIRRFCLQEGICQSKFRNWFKESGSVERVAGSFVPLRLVEVDGRLFPLIIVG